MQVLVGLLVATLLHSRPSSLCSAQVKLRFKNFKRLCFVCAAETAEQSQELQERTYNYIAYTIDVDNSPDEPNNALHSPSNRLYTAWLSQLSREVNTATSVARKAYMAAFRAS